MYTKGYDFLLRVVQIGGPNVGKTSLLRRYVHNEYSDSYLCSIGIDILVKRLELDDKIYQIQIWDTAGQERFGAMTNLQSFQYENMKLGILEDIESQESFNQLICYYEQIQRIFDKEQEKPAIIMCGLKCDLETKRQVSRDVAQAFADQYNLEYIENSSKMDKNVDITFELLTMKMGKQKEKDIQQQEMEKYLNAVQEQKQKQKKENC